MNRTQVLRLCALAGLGEPLDAPHVIMGGLLHRMWRLQTTQGTFAVKCLNAAIMRKPGILDAYRVAENIASMMAAHSIPAVAALANGQGEVLYELDGMVLLLYPWIEGEILAAGAVELARARQMGALLAQMHALQLDGSALGPVEWGHFEDEDWDILTFQASDFNLPWANPVRAALPRLLEWTRAYEQAGLALGQRMVVSHTDLDQKNVIWQDATTPWLIDWEAAGLCNPTMDLVSVALHWSGVATGEPQADVFTAVLESYVEAGGTIQDAGMDAIHGFMGTWLGWLLFNMRRSLGESVTSEEEQRIGTREAATTLTILRTIDLHKDVWAALVDTQRLR